MRAFIAERAHSPANYATKTMAIKREADVHKHPVRNCTLVFLIICAFVRTVCLLCIAVEVVG
jgi:hypothetical protein